MSDVSFVFDDDVTIPPSTAVTFKIEVRVKESDIAKIVCIRCNTEFPTLQLAAQHQQGGCP